MSELKIFRGLNHPLLKLPGNRAVKLEKNLLESISRWGNLMPVLIIETNLYNHRGERGKKLYIIDGQHRIEAAKLLEINFEGIILDWEPENKSEIRQLMIDLNRTAKKWNVNNFIENWKHEGLRDYKELIRIHKEHKPYSGSINTTAAMLSGYCTRETAKIGLNKGTFKITDQENTNKTLKFVAKIYGFGKLNDRMILGLYKVMREDGFNPDKFTIKYKRNYKSLKDKNLDNYYKIFKTYSR